MEAVGTAGYVANNKYIFDGRSTLVSSVTLVMFVGLSFLLFSPVFCCFERRFETFKGKKYPLTPKPYTWGFVLWSILSIVGDTMFIFAISVGLPLALGGLLSHGIGVLMTQIGTSYLFRQHLNSAQWRAIGLGVLASVGTVLVAFQTKGSLFSVREVPTCFGVPVWIFLALAATLIFCAKELLSRWLLERVPVGTSMFWNSVFTVPMCAAVILISYGVWADSTNHFPPHFIGGVFFASLCLIFAVPFRHMAKRQRVNPVLQGEFRRSVMLVLLFGADFVLAGFSIGRTTSPWVLTSLAGVVLISLSSSLLLVKASLSKAELKT
jgi:drug/metabolite transporter (DMT)-like permease